MVDFGEHQREDYPPSLEVPTHDEIREDIRGILDRFGVDNPALVGELTQFCVLTMVEVTCIQDPAPVPLQRLGTPKIELIRHLLSSD
jgi:hypothetical protein